MRGPLNPTVRATGSEVPASCGGHSCSPALLVAVRPSLGCSVCRGHRWTLLPVTQCARLAVCAPHLLRPPTCDCAVRCVQPAVSVVAVVQPVKPCLH